MKKSRNIRYLTNEGIKNIGTNRLMSVASIAVLMSCLVMIGSAVLIYLNVDKLMVRIGEQNKIMVFVDADSDEATVQRVKQQIDTIENIQAVEYISKQEAYNRAKKQYGENALLIEDADAAESIYPEGFELVVKDMTQFDSTVAQLQSIEHVSVGHNREMAAKFSKVRQAVTYISIAIISLLFLVSMFIIANTIRITMFSRKLEISIMKAVGATNWFIRWPFLIEGVTIGLISSVLAFGILYLIYYLTGDTLKEMFELLDNELIIFWDYAPYIAVGFVAVSIITSGIGSIFSIGRYLKEQGSVVLDEN